MILSAAFVLLSASIQEESRPYPSLVTTATRKDPAALAELEKPGTVIFTDGFETADSLKNYFEIHGREEGNAVLTTDSAIAHRGKGAIRFTGKVNGGKSSGAGANYWFGAKGGYDRIYLRWYEKYAPDYDQGNLNHTGAGIAGVVGDNKWAGMGGAGKRPMGDDSLSSRFEPWCDWRRLPPPGYLFCYVYWMDMRIDKDGNYWGNMLGPDPSERIVPKRNQWVCMEQMIKLNSFEKGVTRADGELAAWVNGKLYLHYKGFRWRSTPNLKLKRFGLDVYIHEARQDNTAWFDDIALSTGYIGP